MVDSDLPKSRRVLLLVDFINPLDFPGAEDLAAPALEAAQATARLARAARGAGLPVLYANDNFGVWRSDFTSMVRQLERRGGTAAQIVKLLRPKKGDLTILKPMHSAFFGSPLEIVLDKMGARSLVIAGLATDICVQLTAGDALLRGYRTAVPADCTAAESEVKKATALAYMREILKCDVRPWEAIMRAKPA
ncbi:cysteine hydrolase [Caenimonas sedimenti]|uniref:Cysteine hydrolase n=1 Tax=Caenimonas sedimenti TaxID=2596921 RepID=A0A562ZWX4_9BURK|nr:isochorismatase family cysteine hydrolase [Caenimonas sedimenti]TWO72891.1 cysteine hydrolase [Caenimonas sedimenti]